MTARPGTTSTGSTLRRLLATATVLGALVLGGCAGPDGLVGLHPAPTEATTSAPLDADGATAVAARLLAARDATVGGNAKADRAARAKVLTGDALRLADARAAASGTPPEVSGLASQPEPTIVAQSRGRQWPRAILASTLDEATDIQWLHVMTSDEPDQPFRIASSVPMFSGAELPALGDEGAGAPLLDTAEKNGRPHSAADAVKAYAAALAQPRGKATDVVAADDPFANRLRTASAAQAKALGRLGALTQTHEPRLDDAITFELADGGAVTFGLMKRTDTISVKPAAKELILPAEYARLVRKRTVTRSMVLNSLEPIVIVLPKTGKGRVIGASDLLVSGRGR